MLACACVCVRARQVQCVALYSAHMSNQGRGALWILILHFADGRRSVRRNAKRVLLSPSDGEQGGGGGGVVSPRPQIYIFLLAERERVGGGGGGLAGNVIRQPAGAGDCFSNSKDSFFVVVFFFCSLFSPFRPPRCKKRW